MIKLTCNSGNVRWSCNPSCNWCDLWKEGV